MSSTIIRTGSTASYNYASQLGAAARQQRVADPDYAQSLEGDVWERARRDSVVGFAIQARRQLVAGLDWYVEPASSTPENRAAAEIVEQCLRQIERFSAARLGLAAAIFRGSSWAHVFGEPKYLRMDGAGKAGWWWCPTRLACLDKRRFELRRPAPEDPLEWYFYGQQPDAGQAWDWSPLGKRRGWYVHHVHDEEESSLGYGLGLLEAIYHYLEAKTDLLVSGIDGADVWARGWITARINSLRETSGGRPNTAVVQEWIDALDDMRTRRTLVYGTEDELAVVNPPKGGSEVVSDMVSYLDQAIVLLVLASNASLLSSGGSFAMAVAKEDTAKTILAYDRQLLEETLTRDVVGLVWRANRRQLARSGVGKAEMPRFRLRVNQQEQPEVLAGVIDTMLNAGVRLRKDEVYERTGFTPPAEGDEVVERKEAPASQGGGFFGG